MAMTVFVFDQDKKVRLPLNPGQLDTLVHDEANGTITCGMASVVKPKNGEYIGFTCIDGLFRLFEITKAGHDDGRGVTEVTATDAAIVELKEHVIEGEVQQLDADLVTALQGILPEGWSIEGDAPDRAEKSRAYFTTAWAMIETFRTLYDWRITPAYNFAGGRIAGRVISLETDEAVFRGRILTSRKDTSKVYITTTGRPISRLYGLGKATGSGDVQTNLTFADAEWSVANGDPVDKPKGQTWVEDPEAAAAHGVHTDIVSITSAENAADLLQKTWEALQERKKPTVNVQATVADMEILPGYEHQKIRLGDLVAVRLKTGEVVEARIIAIKRDYLKPWLTVITAGDKKADITTQVSALITNTTHTFERLTIYKNRFHEDEALIQLNANHIQLNANTIVEHAQQILLMAESKAEKDELNQVYILIDSINEELVLKADKISLNAIETEIKGLVRMDELHAEVIKAVGESHFGRLSADAISAEGSVSAQNVGADYVTGGTVRATGSLYISGDEVTKTTSSVVTSVSPIMDDSGNVIGINATTTPISYYQ